VKVADVNAAVVLLARRADLVSRLAAVSQADSLMKVADAITGSGLDDTLLQRSRADVSDFLRINVTDIETQLTALGVELT
jgi:hypothetical protein